MMDLKNEVALITGSARGIGKSIALRYASKGRQYRCQLFKDKENGDSTVRVIEALGVRALGAFAWRLGDQDVADLVNFIRSSWGNSAPAMNAGDVAGVRKAFARAAD
jgi:NAD(P)-dependent dehydrogenase (short-subunit alcohol dehydrogenase family)